LANAIYFKANWQTHFFEALTKDEPFYLLGGGDIKVPLMRRTGRHNYFESSQLQALELSYKDSELSMFVFLPKDKKGLAEVEKTFICDSFKEWLSKLEPKEVVVSFPKFKLADTFELQKTLMGLGIKDAFSQATADFTKVSDEKEIFLSQVIHKTYIDVDEEGTEAAAVTVIAMAAGARPRPPENEEPKIFIADHPFLFVIRHNKIGTILFVGRVVNPLE